MVAPTGTSSPASRRARTKATAIRSGATADRLRHQRTETLAAEALLIFAVLDHRAQRRRCRGFGEIVLTERREGQRPIDRLGDTRRLVEAALAHRRGGRGDVTREPLAHSWHAGAHDGHLPIEVGML